MERLRAGIQGFSTWLYQRQNHPTTLSSNGRGSELDYKLMTIQNDWIQSLAGYQFPVVEMTREATIDAVCHIFEKVNSTGQSLTMFELLTARFWAKGIHLRDKWSAAQRYRGGILQAFEIDPLDLLRIVSLLAEVPDAGRPGAVFKLSAEAINRHWDSAVRGMAMALDLLADEFGVVEKQWLPYAPMLLPLAAIEAGRPAAARPEAGGRLERLHRWYWCSIFSGAYVQGAAGRAVADYHALTRWLDNPINEPPPEAVRTFPGFWPGRLRELSKKGQAEYKACIGIILRRKPRDLASGEPLINPRLAANQLQRRFLFPKTQLGDQVPRQLKDSILNTTMTRTRLNRATGQQMPATYLTHGKRTLGARLPKILDEHLLPSNEDSAFWQNRYERFLDERAALFAAEISQLTGVPCQRDAQHGAGQPRREEAGRRV